MSATLVLAAIAGGAHLIKLNRQKLKAMNEAALKSAEKGIENSSHLESDTQRVNKDTRLPASSENSNQGASFKGNPRNRKIFQQIMHWRANILSGSDTPISQKVKSIGLESDYVKTLNARDRAAYASELETFLEEYEKAQSENQKLELIDKFTPALRRMPRANSKSEN